MRRSKVESLESRRLLTYVLPAFADQIGLGSLVDPNTTFEDNFDGTSLNHDNWQVRKGPRWRKVPNGAISEMSVTGEESIVVRNGNLELIAHTDPATGQNRAGYIQTGSRFLSGQPSDIEAPRLVDGYDGNFEQAFGYWESRVKFSSLPGQWSAFWVHSYGMVQVGTDPAKINHPEIYGAEYDVAEHGAVRQGFDASSQISVVAHANGYENYQRSNAVHTNTGNYGPSFSNPDQFHVYGMLWTPTYVKFFIDGNLVNTQTDPAMVSKVPHVAIFSNDIGAGGALYPNSGSNFFGNVPAQGYGSLETSTSKLTADYVRVWKLASAPTSTSVLEGRVINDANGNGVVDAGETGQAGVKVYIDNSYNNIRDDGEPQAITNADGAYRIESSLTGGVAVRLNLAGTTFVRTLPGGDGTRYVNLTLGQATAAEPFCVKTTVVPPTYATISGTVYNDANRNGLRETAENGRANVVVYLDLNFNGQRDLTEPSQTTSSTGTYRFEQVTPATVAVKLAATGLTITAPTGGTHWLTAVAGQNYGDRHFGVFETVVGARIAGTVYRDANTNGSRQDGEAGVPNITVYLDANFNNRFDAGERSTLTSATGTYVFEQVPAGTVAVRIVLTDAYRQITPTSNGSIWLNAVNGGNYVDRQFGIIEAVIGARIAGTVYRDTNTNGSRQDGEAGVPNITVYLDANYNNRFDVGERSTVTSATGTYVFEQVPAGTVAVRIVLTDAYRQITPTSNGSIWLNAVNGGNYVDRQFGIVEAVIGARIAGTVYLDANTNGSRQDGEAGVANVTVYLDANYNNRLDAGERSAVTSATGTYVFEQVPAGVVAVRVVLTDAYRQITPAANASIWLNAYNGGNFGDKLFGIARVATPAAANTIAGSVFADWNNNGRRDDGENGLGAFRVYLDSNFNGRYDVGEQTASTNGAGGYIFEAVRAGTIAIRVDLLGLGWVQSFPTANASLWHNFTSGMNLKDQNFLIRPK